jgi:azurin
VRWRRFASGLHQPLGLVVGGDGIFVQGRDQLTRLHDLNADGEADFYERVSGAFETSPAGHDFISGLERDASGAFYTASGNQGLVRIAPDGKTAEVVAAGLRNPAGLGVLPDGTLTVSASEGEWTPASMVCAVRPARRGGGGGPAAGGRGEGAPHFGYGGPQGGRPPELPLAYLPRGLDNSSGGQTYISSERWGPLAGKLLHFSFGSGSHFLILSSEAGGRLQGAVVPLPGEFLSGAQRGRFHPGDGQLYVSGMAGWGSYSLADGCFHRVRYTGAPVQVPVGFHVHQNGVLVEFTAPLAAAAAARPESHFAQCWNYRYSAAYGSPEHSPSHPGTPGHDPLAITGAHVLGDGRSLFLEVPALQPVSQLHLLLRVSEEETRELFVTVHAMDEPFTGFAGYRPVAKTIAAHPLLSDLALRAGSAPNPWRYPIAGARHVTIETGKNLSFATRSFRVRAGEGLELVLENPDVVPHNWVLVRPGSLRRVGELANRLIAAPEAVARHYVPETPEVLVYTDIVPPRAAFTAWFRAPEEPGRYPYLCTFPGHWMVMNGEMVVE